MLVLLQEPLISQHYQNPVAPQARSCSSMCLSPPFLPLRMSPLSGSQHRTWRRLKKQLPSVGPKWTPSSILSLLIISFSLQLLSRCSQFCFIYPNVFCSYPFAVRAFLNVRKLWPPHCCHSLPVSLHQQLLLNCIQSVRGQGTTFLSMSAWKKCPKSYAWG